MSSRIISPPWQGAIYLVTALDRLANDPVAAIRLQAIRGLWQAWFWNADVEVRGKIEDTLLAGLAQPQHSWVESNLHAAIYNLADENIRYLYNNWVALLAKPEDRDRAIQGRLAVGVTARGQIRRRPGTRTRRSEEAVACGPG